MINLDGTRTLCSYIFGRKPERFLGNRSYISASIYFILDTNEANLCVLTGNALLIATRKNTGSTIIFCILSSSIQITYMPVAIKPVRFGKHKIYYALINREFVHTRKYLLWRHDVRTERSDFRAAWRHNKYFPYGPNSRLIRALLYTHTSKTTKSQCFPLLLWTEVQPVHTPVRTQAYGLALSQSNFSILSVFCLVYNNISYFRKWENNLLAAAVQIHDVIDKNEHFHLQNTPCANVWTGAKGSNRITLHLPQYPFGRF